MIRIDLFKLHDNSDQPRGLIVAKGKNLKLIIQEIILEINRMGISNTALVKHIMKRMGISIITAERMVYLERKCEYIKREWFPLAFLNEIIKLSDKKYYFDIQDKIEYLRIGNMASKPIKPLKFITEELCKIAGAHAADGTLFDNRQYGTLIRIVDGHKSNVFAYAKWIYTSFNLELKPIKSKYSKNMWEIGFKNKIIGRYLNKILGFSYGCKTFDVKEPKIIKKASFNLRKAFALGYLTFEAGCGIKPKIELCCASKHIVDDICDIFSKDNMKFVRMRTGKHSVYWRAWSPCLSHNEAKRWLSYFEPKTEKWFKLYEYIYGFQGKVDNYESACKALSYVFPHQPGSKTTTIEVLSIIRKKGRTWRYDIEKETRLKSAWAHSLRHYITILIKANIIKIKKGRFGKKKSFGTIIRDVYFYNPEVTNWKIPYRPTLEGKINYVSGNHETFFA